MPEIELVLKAWLFTTFFKNNELVVAINDANISGTVCGQYLNSQGSLDRRKKADRYKRADWNIVAFWEFLSNKKGYVKF